MPEMTLLGWFHTILGILAVLSGFYTLYKYKVISTEESSGRLYVLVTLLVAGSALGRFWGCSYPRCFNFDSTIWRLYHGKV